MNILFVLPQIYPFYTGGAEVFHLHLIEQLSNDHNVGYIGFDNINKEKIHFYPIKRVKPWKFFTPLQTIFSIIKLRKVYDIVHLNYSQEIWYHWFYYPLLKFLFGIKYAITIHDGILLKWNHPKLFAWVFNNATFVVGVSERIKENYEKRCNREILYQPPLIPLRKSKKDIRKLKIEFELSPSSKVILFAGSLKSLKRPLLLIESIGLLGSKWLVENNIMVIIAGGGKLETECKSKINELSISSWIRLVGRIPQEDIYKLYSIASLYVIPSIHEGKSISLIEAMYNKLPIIASDAPGINEVIFDERNGLLFELDNVSHLAKQIRRAIEDIGLAKQIGEQAYKDYLRQFRFEDMLNEYIKLYPL
jgi:glycosyltransferase involved in cell wall biosynthesis